MADPRVRRFLQLLINQGFIEETYVTTKGSRKKLFRFGPLGSLLRRNILRRWWDAIVLQQPNTFCVENPILVPRDETLPDNSKSVELLQGTVLRSSLSYDCSSTYLAALRLTKGQLPVSVTSSGLCFHSTSGSSSEQEESNPFGNGLGETQMLLQNYCPPVNVAQVYDYWLRSRLRWWRQFSSNPSKFSSSSSTERNETNTKENGGHALIKYTFPWGPEAVETISNYGDAQVRQLEKRTGISHQGKYHQKTFYPHLIECRTSVEQCMSVFLTDAYREQETKRKTAQQSTVNLALHIHPLLSPYQTAMSVRGTRVKEVQILAERVSKELRGAGISVFTSPSNSDSLETQNRRNDEMGVPYTIVMSDETLQTGVVTIRNRDTRIKQTLHISKLQSLLLQSIEAQGIV